MTKTGYSRALAVLAATLAAALMAATIMAAAALAAAKAGSLDTTFGGDGKVTTPIGSSGDGANDVAIGPDGKIVVAGSSFNGTSSVFALARYDADGTLDTTFSGDGKVTTTVNADAVINDVAVDSGGKITVAGHSFTNPTFDFAVARYNADGTLDTTFNGGTPAVVFIGTGNDSANGVATAADGKVVEVGTAQIGANNDFALIRLNANGLLDNATFGSAGRVTTDIGDNDVANEVAIAADQKIVAGGSSSTGDNNDFALARYNTDGTLDTTFDTDGKLTTAITSGNDVANGMAIGTDGKIVMAGLSNNGPNNDFALARYDPDGSLDASFSGDGKVTTPVGSGDDEARDVAIGSDGKIVAAGLSHNGTNFDFALARYNPNGSLDTSFSGDGKVTTPVGSGNDLANGVAVGDKRKIVVVGSSVNGADSDFALARYIGKKKKR